jgi:Fe-S-cluster containining protein
MNGRGPAIWAHDRTSLQQAQALGSQVEEKVRAAFQAQYGEGSPEHLARWVGGLLAAYEEQLESRPDKPARSCHRGCDACCRIHATVSVPELVLLVQAIREQMSEPQQQVLRARVADRAQAIWGHSSARRMVARIPCGLLEDDGTCLAYEIRPGVCRSENSLEDPQRCGPPPQRHKTFWGSQFLVYNQAILTIRQMLSEKGRDGEAIELTLGLHIALEEESAFARWAAGDKSVFAPAHIHNPIVQYAGHRSLPLIQRQEECWREASSEQRTPGDVLGTDNEGEVRR